MKKISLFVIGLILVSLSVYAQNDPSDLNRAIRVNGNVPGWYILSNSISVSKLTVPMADSLGNLNIGSYAFPKEKLVVAGSIKIASSQSYSTVTANSATPVPLGGGGTIIYLNGHFYGWIGTAWKQLDN